MAESSTITRGGGRSGCQLKLCALNGDVSMGALLEASKPNASIRILMTAQDDQLFAIVSSAHATASSNQPEIFGVDHVEPPRWRFPTSALFLSGRQQADLTSEAAA